MTTPTFTCERLRCRMSVLACVARQVKSEESLEYRNHIPEWIAGTRTAKVPVYPHCLSARCAQGLANRLAELPAAESMSPYPTPWLTWGTEPDDIPRLETVLRHPSDYAADPTCPSIT